MTDLPFKTVAVLGAGAMGRGIAQLAAEAGSQVLLYDAKAGAADDAKAFIEKLWRRDVEKQRIEESELHGRLKLLSVAGKLEDLKAADLAIEAVIEDLQVKLDLLRDIETLLDDKAIIASNTSSLSITQLAAGLERPGQVAGLHFFNPAPLMKVVEVIPGLASAPSVIERLQAFVSAFGHHAVVAKDTPGFLVNHAGRAYSTEALKILSEGVAPPSTIDRILRDALGFRMGPFELLDLTGLDVSQQVMEQVYNQFYQDDRYRPSHLGAQRLAGRILGRKTGSGFYDYEDGAKVEPITPTPDISKAPKEVWVQPGQPDLLARWLRDRGVGVYSETPAPRDMLCLVTPLGYDCTMELQRWNLDPRRTVAVDMLCGFNSHRTIMTNPATSEEHRDQAWAVMALDGTPVSVIRASPGFVGQRVLAQIIDTAVKLGLGYPHGPLEFGDLYGPDKILYVLDALQETTGDPRYRASLWLRRRSTGLISMHQEELTSP